MPRKGHYNQILRLRETTVTSGDTLALRQHRTLEGGAQALQATASVNIC